MMTTLLNNRYQITQVLGNGGFSETFLAEDTHMPSRRRCVIKQLKPHATNDPQMYQQIQQRFQREAATLESLGEGSGQIPKLYAYFSENGQFYLVQEWIQGQTLTSIVEAEGPLSETVVRNILVSLLPVLDYVHSKSIIHRDIKPDNIILRHSDSKPVLIDFGALKETMAAAVNPQGNTNHSIVLGTPGFMPPEQASGRPVYASDLYSMGLTAIYLLTGKLPQQFETDEKTDEMLWQRHALNVSPSLAAVLNKATQYHPRDRYTTAMKMLDALQSAASIPPRQSSMQATLVVSPPAGKVSSQPAPAIAPQTAAVINHPSKPGNSQKALLLGSLLAGGLLCGAIVVSFVRNQPPQSSIVTSPLPQSTIEEPIARSTPAAAESPAPLSKPAPVPSLSPSPSPDSPPQQDNEPPAVKASSPPQQDNENRNDSANNAVRKSVPGFPTGTSESRVKAALGNPTKTSRGIWSNTRAVTYDLKPNQITLGYLFDQNSGRLRQTEVAFAQSVDPKIMRATLQGMLGDRTFINVNEGLRRVYHRRANTYSFNIGALKGVIERNDSDRIYIGIWDADLH